MAIESTEKIAKILRVDRHTVQFAEDRLEQITGKKNVLDKIVQENADTISNRFACLGISSRATAKEIYDTLISKLEADDHLLFEALGRPSVRKPEDWRRVLDIALEVTGKPKGFFLKKEKAVELLEKEPPRSIMESLGYKTVAEMLAKEDLFEVWSALRFIEGSEWLNNVFFKQYADLKPEDFEYREITTRAIPKKWIGLSQGFIKKKYHNISHLKELGLIFVLPLSLDISGEVIRNLSLVFHYFNEVPFYSSLFERFAKTEATFAQNIISLLRGDIIEQRPLSPSQSAWLIVQRYLAKDDENDWRLFEPHLNPEALHWERAEGMLIQCGDKLDGFSADLSFWKDLNWVGDFYPTDTGIDVLVSFNLIDTAMSLVKEKELVKYLYHHQEALWNKIFSEYFGEDKMEEYMKENIIRGWFDI